MNFIQKLKSIRGDIDKPFLIDKTGPIYFRDLEVEKHADISAISPGDVVALVGDVDAVTITNLLKLIELKAIIVPLTKDTAAQHHELQKQVGAKFCVNGLNVTKLQNRLNHILLSDLKDSGRGGLILFSSGTTGKPKAILHDLTVFLKRFETPRASLRTVNFLLFDHIGGLNTLFHTLFNSGTIISPKSRNVDDVLEACDVHKAELLPTTPTFLRLLLLSGNLENRWPASVKLVTYGTEKMDQITLDMLCKHLPGVDFRQTYGMSELGILRIKSEKRNSLFMKIGGEGVQTRVKDGVLEIKSENRMLGYLNSPDPFDEDGWYNTKDTVTVYKDYYRIDGRTTDLINVGGLKFNAHDVERVAYTFEGVEFVKVKGVENPITGQHVEMIVQLDASLEFDASEFKSFLSKKLASHMVPRRISYGKVEINHRFKRS